MRLGRGLLTVFSAALLAGCGGELISSSDGQDAQAPVHDGGRLDDLDAGRATADAGRTTVDAGPAESPADGGTPARDAGIAPGFDAGPCTGTTLSSALSVTPLDLSGGAAPRFASPTDSGGVVVAARQHDAIRIQRFSGGGSPVGSAVSVAGNGLWGLDTSSDTWAVLVSRGSDALYLVGVEPSGTMRFEVLLLGEVDQAVMGSAWFGPLIRTARLRFTGSEWSAYYSVQQRRSDGIAHYGDQLRFFDEAGAPTRTGWSWGCSHSMEVRLQHNGAALLPVCASDCYPSKGIHVNHRGGMIYPDEGRSNCAGGYGTTLGDIVPVPGGFWVTFTATDGRASHDVGVAHVSDRHAIAAPIWLTADAHDDRNVRAAPYGSDIVVGWTGAHDQLVRLDSFGNLVEGPVSVPEAKLASSSDFFVYSNGDVGWITGAGELARLRSCH